MAVEVNSLPEGMVARCESCNAVADHHRAGALYKCARCGHTYDLFSKTQ